MSRSKKLAYKQENYPPQFKAEVEGLEKLLTELFKVEAPFHVTVYAFEDDPPYNGFRIAEIDIHSETAGSSFMRSTIDLHTSALILAAEDFVRVFHVKPFRPQGWKSDMDELEDAKDKLRYVVEQCLAPIWQRT